MCAHCSIIIQENAFGCIRRSRCCHTLNVEFGSLMTGLPSAALERFAEFVGRIDDESFERAPRRTGRRAKMAIELQPTKMFLTVDRAQLRQLKALLKGAGDYLQLVDLEAQPAFARN